MFSSTRILLLSVLVLSCFAMFGCGRAAQLPIEEVNTMKQIAKTLGKGDWNFSVDPCATEGFEKVGFEDELKCDCSFANGTICHVVSIFLEKNNLQGVLPPELSMLPNLQSIDLTRNFLSGTIPTTWGSMQLVHISVQGNRLSGPIPKELGNIATLKNLVLEVNRFSSTLPRELGNMVELEKLQISSNEFTGELPETLANLTNLKEFRISDNNFTGNIPDFVKNWTKLERIHMEASGLKGPIASGISLLESLNDLRISDINGTSSTFPPLSSMKDMKTLILRNCNISGPIPRYVGEMANLKTLDLSYNKLSGEIPATFATLLQTNMDFMYLTSNLLTGPVPDWMLNKEKKIDLSYNNFTSSETSDCRVENVNLLGSSSMLNNVSGVSPICLKNLGCPRRERVKLHINCGGSRETVNRSRTYVEDKDSGGASRYFMSSTDYWAFSSTGEFLDGNAEDNYIAQNTSILSFPDSALYTSARLAPISLVYYGLCLKNGNYTVRLHFAEIMFTADNTYSSLGKRIFDVYIQGRLVRKDFNIEDEADGPNKPYVENFNASVTTNTLKIHFNWAGKGTQSIPDRGTAYGPLISAISVDPNFDVDDKNLSPGAVAGIIISALFVTLSIFGILWWKGCLGRKEIMDEALRGLDLQTGSFTLRQIKAATNNFDPANKIGEGGFGPVYKGLLLDGTIIAVKQLSSKSKQGNREFVNEIGVISALQHPHLVKLYGCCIEGNQLLLVYEYMQNNSLARALFGLEDCQLKLDWPTRHKICIGIARGLTYLHEESRLKIVHRDIKATNVLLDRDLNPKISDFGLAKLDEEDDTHISTRIAGTLGYMAPEYALRGYLTDKADVYSFGVVALEIVSGKSNASYKAKEDGVYLLDWAYVLQEKGKLMELVDPKLGMDFNKDEAMAMINVALLCTSSSPALRPSMSSVVSVLEGRTVVQKHASDSNYSEDDMMLKAMRSKQQSQHSDSQSQSLFMHGPWTSSSTSAPDLYPINMDSQYRNDRE